jgi:hypothetical protein
MAVRVSSSLIGRTLLTTNIFYFCLSYKFLLEAEQTPGPMRPEGLGDLTEFNYLIGSRTDDLPACITAPQPLRYRVPYRANRH